MTDLTKFPDAMKPVYVYKDSAGIAPLVFLRGSRWQAVSGNPVVGFLRAQRVDVLKLNEKGAVENVTFFDLPRRRVRALVQGPDERLYIATDERKHLGRGTWHVTGPVRRGARISRSASRRMSTERHGGARCADGSAFPIEGNGLACRPWNRAKLSSPPSAAACGAGHDRDGVGHRVFLGSMTAMRRPRRWMWMRSATSNTCGMLWLISTIGRPRRFTSRISSSTLRDSLTPERRGRLVHDDDAAAERRGARDGHALALAAGKRLDRLADVLDGEQPEVAGGAAPCFCMPARSSCRNTVPKKPGCRRSRPRNRLSAIDSAGDRARFW